MHPYRVTCFLSAILFAAASCDVTTAEDYVILSSGWPDDRDVIPAGVRYDDDSYNWPSARGEEEPEEREGELNPDWVPEHERVGKRVWGAKKERVWGKRSKRAPATMAAGARRESANRLQALLAERLLDAVERSRSRRNAAGIKSALKRKWGQNTPRAWGRRRRSVRSVSSSDSGTNGMQDTPGMGSVDRISNEVKLIPVDVAASGGKSAVDGEPSLSGESTQTASLTEVIESERGILGNSTRNSEEKEEVSQSDWKRKWGDNSARAWGKRGEGAEVEGDKRKWGDDSARAWGKREATERSETGSKEFANTIERNLDQLEAAAAEEEKRKWGESNARTWGKREVEEEEKRKWGESNVRTWGKRDAEEEKKQKWGGNSARAWGKRGIDVEELKRKWGDNSARAWGKRAEAEREKRKWGDNSARAWGKRDEIGDAKRKWGDKNSARAWGKRDKIEEEKRKWGDNSARAWGKRDETEEEKRKWGDNSARAWGKRDKKEEEKRKWGDNSARAWGKRDKTEKEKRKWGDNSARAWGKRDETEEEKRKWGDNSARAWGKRDETEKEKRK